ncbi:MAG: FHA domain-containing protein [Anaerolineae bacterium]|nr:FHA domain-containing protein [Anaerolineae bacterium]
MSNEQVICENCGKPNAAHEGYCFACGNILPAGMQAIATRGLSNESTLKPQLRWGTAYFGDQMILRMHVRGANEWVEKHFSEECVLGRTASSDGCIDLTEFGAVDLGVSREHAKLTRQSATIMVQDLGSTNGTYLNGQKLLPYQPRVLRNEDELSLGELVLRVSFMRSPR